MDIGIYQVDAFTNHVFAGNPAAVCPLTHWLDEQLMQEIAMENNLSETAFFLQKEDVFEIRWLTPVVEIDLCGHATLASAHVIFNHLDYREHEIHFKYSGGDLTVSREEDRLKMNFPSTPAIPSDPKEVLINGLGAEPVEVLKSRDYMAVYENEHVVRSLKPNFALLEKLNAIGIIATAPGKSADFVSRFFAPAAGINEDPVTGSAHCTLIPYWAERLNKSKMDALQVSPRGGQIYCDYLGDRVGIAGHAITYMVGQIHV